MARGMQARTDGSEGREIGRLERSKAERVHLDGSIAAQESVIEEEDDLRKGSRMLADEREEGRAHQSCLAWSDMRAQGGRTSQSSS